MSMNPAADYLIVQVDPPEGDTVTDAGIIVPQAAQNDALRWGTCISVGPDVKRVQGSQRVAWLRHSGVSLDPGGQQLLLRDDQVVGTK
jgi:co-chaperonin GroES (HSP10)